MNELCTFVEDVYYNVGLPWTKLTIIFLFGKMCAGSTLAWKLHIHALLMASEVLFLSLSDGTKLGFSGKECFERCFQRKGVGFLATSSLLSVVSLVPWILLHLKHPVASGLFGHLLGELVTRITHSSG